MSAYVGFESALRRDESFGAKVRMLYIYFVTIVTPIHRTGSFENTKVSRRKTSLFFIRGIHSIEDWKCFMTDTTQFEQRLILTEILESGNLS